MTLLTRDQHTHIMKLLYHMKDGPKPKTELMYEVRFNSKQINFYLELLLQKNLINKSKGFTVASQERDVYGMTKTGTEVLKALLKLKELLE